MDTKETEKVINLVINKVILPQCSDDRVTFVTNQTFETIDVNTGEVKESNMFSINIYNLTSQVGSKVDYIQLADALSMGAMINPKIVSLSMINSECVIKRTFHAAGEQRKFTNDSYTKDCWTTEFMDVKTHISRAFDAMLQKLITEEPCIIRVAAVPNPFNIG